MPKSTRWDVIERGVRDSLHADHAILETLTRLFRCEDFRRLARHCASLPADDPHWRRPATLALQLLTIINASADRLRRQRERQRQKIAHYYIMLDALDAPSDAPNAARDVMEEMIAAAESLVPPENILSTTGRPAPDKTVRYRLIAALIPPSYAPLGTNLHKITVEVLARALGVFEKGLYSDVFGAAGMRKRRPKPE